MRALGLGLLAVSLGGCSLWVGGFEECAADTDCRDGRVCRERYCVIDPVPEGCGRVEGAADAPGVITLGATLPLTSGGQTDQSEVMGLNALLLALEEVNQRDGVGGRRFALHVCDTRGEGDRIRAQAAWLADQQGAPAIITSGSGHTLAASAETIGRGVLLISATATSPELTTLPDSHQGSVGLVWRTAPSDAIQGAVVADILLNDAAYASVQRVGLLYLFDPYGQGLASVLLEAFEGTSRTLLPIPYDRGAAVDAAVNQLDAFDPDLTILVGFPDDLTRALNLAAGKPNLGPSAGHQWFFTDSAKDPQLISGTTTPGQLEGSLGTAPAQGAGSAYAQFRASFQTRYGADPGQFSFTAHSYDALYLLALGSAFAVGEDGQGAVTGVRIAQGLTKLSAGTTLQLRPTDLTPAKGALQRGESINVVGASGNLDFDPATGEAPSPIEVWRVVGDGFQTVESAREPPGP
jgi:branched-chain amino acid transport system substrate-binding protein